MIVGLRRCTTGRHTRHLDPAASDAVSSVFEEDGDLDVYGQIHPTETEALMQKSLHDFHAVLEHVPNKKKHNALQAIMKCPEMITDSFKLMFLRCECYNTEVSQFSFVTSVDLSFRLLHSR